MDKNRQCADRNEHMRIFILLTALLSCPAFAGSNSRSAQAPTGCADCPRDNRSKIKRSKQATRAFRAMHPCPATGETKGTCPGFVIDHVRSLHHGGADAPENMQWQTVAAWRAKDRVED
jgi:hypothetical protein